MATQSGGADSRGPLRLLPTLEPALLFPESALGESNPYPRLRPGESSARLGRAEAGVAPDRVRPGLGWEPPSSASRRQRISPGAAKRAEAVLMSIMLIMVHLLKSWGTGSEHATPAAAYVFDR